MANVTIPLLRADFLPHYQLLVDVSRSRLVDTASLASKPIATTPDDLSIQVIDVADDFSVLRTSYPDLIKPKLR